MPHCCEHSYIHEVAWKHVDSSYNHPCYWDVQESSGFEHYGKVEECTIMDMKEAQTATNKLNTWYVMLGCLMWMVSLVYLNTFLSKMTTHHDAEHKHAGHDDDL